MLSKARSGLLLTLFATLGACTHVASYERGKLAHPTMSDDGLFTSPASQHVYAIHEGATGGGAIGSSGCGCN